MMIGLGHDLRYGLRQIRRNPGFAAAAALTLALGIAATTTVFSFVDAALLRPLPYPDPNRLFVLWNARTAQDEATLSYPNFVDYQQRNTLFQHLALYHRRRLNVAATGGPERVIGATVSTDFFRTLGITPRWGRDFANGEDAGGQDQVAVVSDRFWRRQLAADPAAVGRPIRVDGATLTVIGVLPAGLGFPVETDIWIPISHEPKWLLESRGLQGYTVLGRLRATASAEQAQAQMSALASALAAEYPQHNQGWTVRLEPLQQALAGDLRPTLLLLFGSAVLLLLIAAVNLAGMLLARATSRQREIAVRRALGAGDGRLVRQLLTEHVVLACLGGAAGIISAMWGVRAWRAIWEDPSGSPSLAVVDWRVLAFAATATVATALLFGLVPALRATRGSLAETMRQGSAGMASLRRTGRVLVAGEIGLALLLAIGGCLLVKSLLRLQAVDPGFNPTGVLTARISLPEASYPEPKQVIAFYQALLREVEALPGVEAAGASDAVPMIPGSGSYGFAIEGRPVQPAPERPVASLASVTPDYFRALGIRKASGRLIEDRDNADVPDVAVINRTMARTFWPGQDPVGARITFEEDREHWLEVVGVVEDVRTMELGSPAELQVFTAHAQWGYPALSLVVRSGADPLDLLRPIQSIARRLDPEIPISEARTMEQALSASMVSPRLRTTIFTGFAGLALLLAGIGVYGVMAYMVTQREHEIALRMALGAGRTGVIGAVIGHSLRLAIPGVGLGLVGAWISARMMKSFLYQVEPSDPLILLLVPVGVAALVVLATLLPARRAARLDPMALLRSD